VRNRVARAAVKIGLPIRERADLVRLGSGYGGWWVPEKLVAAGGTAYCAGVGHDISFDLALIERYGCEVWAFDPTPAVIEWVDHLRAPGRWHFEPVGLWSRTDVIRFFAPASDDHVSFSATDPQSARFIEAPVETLDAIMARLGHLRLDLLKMDIEGAEGPVLDAMLVAKILPSVVCVEFDQPEPPWALAHRIRQLLDVGYELNKIEHWNYTFSRPRVGTDDPRTGADG
jgi:FkbM family methyltransferase